MSRWKYMKAALAGLGTGICLMSLIAALQDNRWPLYKQILIGGGFGIGCGLSIGCLVYERDERRRYQRLYESDNKRMKMLCGDEKLDSDVKLAIETKLEHNLEHNLDEESSLLNGGSITHSSIDELKQILESISKRETLMNEKLEFILSKLQTNNGKP